MWLPLMAFIAPNTDTNDIYKSHPLIFIVVEGPGHELFISKTKVNAGLVFSECLYFIKPCTYDITFLHAPLGSSKPSLVDLLTFPGKERMINIPQEIGTNYVPFGILLLKDDTGAVVDAIGLKHKDNVQMINLEVLREWVTGKGRQPVSWQTLIDVLYSIGLSTLASDIQDVKCT